jgi:biotin carboxyl carrier protein
MVIEAMKMQNELKSPKAGRVVKVAAGVGDTVSAGEVLAVIE